MHDPDDPRRFVYCVMVRQGEWDAALDGVFSSLEAAERRREYAAKTGIAPIDRIQVWDMELQDPPCHETNETDAPMNNPPAVFPDDLARQLCRAAVAQERCGDLLNTIEAGGGATIDDATGELVTVPAVVLERIRKGPPPTSPTEGDDTMTTHSFSPAPAPAPTSDVTDPAFLAWLQTSMRYIYDDCVNNQRDWYGDNGGRSQCVDLILEALIGVPIR